MKASISPFPLGNSHGTCLVHNWGFAKETPKKKMWKNNSQKHLLCYPEQKDNGPTRVVCDTFPPKPPHSPGPLCSAPPALGHVHGPSWEAVLCLKHARNF